MQQNETSATRDRKTVYDEITNDVNRDPLTLEELRQRLKHIAGLCWGLSIDLNNEVARNEQLAAENKQLKEKLRSHRKDGRRVNAEALDEMTPEERERYERRLEQKRLTAEKKRKQKAIEMWRRNNENN